MCGTNCCFDQNGLCLKADEWKWPVTKTARCNICKGKAFEPFRGRPNEKCSSCGSLARHRTGWIVYEKHLLNSEAAKGRILHLAPEPWLYPKLSNRLHQGYITADAYPETYPHAPCLRLFFPKDFEIFPDGYFSAILHNHVLEHIPGHYVDHLREFTRLLAPGGKHIISVPGPYKGIQTKEGGEHLASDAERLEQFLQEDHYKLFGDDFTDTLCNLEDGELIADGVTDEMRAEISVRPGKAKYFVWQRKPL